MDRSCCVKPCAGPLSKPRPLQEGGYTFLWPKLGSYPTNPVAGRSPPPFLLVIFYILESVPRTRARQVPQPTRRQLAKVRHSP
jgi:hypothetical protein